MTCPDPVWCLGDHIRPRLEPLGWAPSGPRPHQYKAWCPVRTHSSREPSLSIGIGEKSGRVEVHCYAGCLNADVRSALVHLGVPDSCLRRAEGQRTEDELASEIIKILETMPAGRDRELTIALAVCGNRVTPTRADLVRLAARFGISGATVYRMAGRDGNATESSHGEKHTTERSSHGENSLSWREGSVTYLTSGFGRSVVSGVSTSVRDNPPGLRPRSVASRSVARRCKWCSRELEPGRTVRAMFCDAGCRQKYQRREKARSRPPSSSVANDRSPPLPAAQVTGRARYE